MKKAVIYARYSSERQTEQSIEGQLRVCHDYAEQNDLLIVDTYIDRAMTGTNDQREAFQQMMRDSEKRAWECVLVYKFDRFSRNKYESTIHKHTLKEYGIKLISAMENIPDSPEGIILESLLEGMNQYYSMELAQKVRRGMNESRLKGQYTGGSVLFGYKVENKKIVINEPEAEIMRQAFEDYANGKYGSEIIEAFEENGITLHGKPFLRGTFYHMLQNEKYIGIYKAGGKVYDNVYPAIISKELFDEVQRKIHENYAGKHPKHVRYLLKNKMRCGYCGNPISSDTGTAYDGSVKRYYKCYGRKELRNGCLKKTIRKEELERIIVEVTLKIMSDENLLSSIADRVMELNGLENDNEAKLNFLLQERQRVKKGIENLVKAIEQGIIFNTTKSRLDELEKQLTDIESKIVAEQTREKVQLTRSDVLRYLKMAIKKEPLPMIQQLVNEIVLYDDKIEIYYKYTKQNPPDDDNRRAFSIYSNNYDYSITTQHYCLDKSIKTTTQEKAVQINMYMTY